MLKKTKHNYADKFPKTMRISKNKTIATVFALFLISAMAVSLVALPIANASDAPTTAAKAAGMKWDFPGNENYSASNNRLLLWNRWKDNVPTYVYIVPTPNPVGVSQEVTFIFFNPQVPSPSSDRYLYTITIGKPDGSTTTLPPPGAAGVYTQSIQDGKFVSDSTGSAWTTWRPDQIGNHTVTVKFWGTAVPHTAYASSSDRDWYGVTLKESTYTKTLVVQKDPVTPASWTYTPLPTEYWSRPIEGQNTEWYRVSSNWLNNAHDADNGGADNKFQEDGIAPNSGHILWTKTTEDGGVVGGNSFSVPGEVFNAGHQYQTRMSSGQIIMWGRLYYRESNWYSASPGDFVCVDLQTGEELWRNQSMMAIPSFGYYYDWDDMNQHGVVEPSWLFSNNYAVSIHPRLGITGFNVTNVPSGTSVYGPKGEDLRYVLSNAGNTTNPAYYLAQWNSSKVFISQVSGKIPGNAPITPARPSNQYWNGSMWVSSAERTAQGYASVTSPAYDWNVSIPMAFVQGSSPSIRGVVYNEVLLISNGSLPSAPSYTYSESATFTGISLKPGSIGQVLWTKTIPLVNSQNQVLDYQRAGEGVFVFQQDPDMSWVAYSMYTGEKLWDSAANSEGSYNPYAYYISSTGYNPTGNAIAYGTLFSTGYVGMVFAYNLTTGKMLWRYEAPTNMEKILYYTLLVGTIADGKIYIGTHEHSADTPLFKGSRIRALDVTTGKEVWSMLGWANPYTVQTADGVLTYWNNYDQALYAVGKGPSATTVEAPMASITQGSSLVIRGTVTDISAGTKQKEQAARFPNGVPAVSDASQSDWMEYVYMQKVRPTDTTGVDVKITVIDPNGNGHEFTTTSDSMGQFSYLWSPPVPGKYTVVAQFAGSESYWPSAAETSFGVDPAPSTPPIATPTASPTPTPTVAPTATATPTSVPNPTGGLAAETYIAIASVVIIAVIAATALVIRKRK